MIRLSELAVLAPGEVYRVGFRPGVNVIAGPILTGKSTILRLIDYCFGAKRSPSIPELAKCTDVLLEVEFPQLEEVLTIRRQLGAATTATVYEMPLEQAMGGKEVGRECGVRHSGDGTSVSELVMQRVGWGGIRVKSAPTQESSDSSAFTLRDLMAFIWLDQDRMGNSRGFHEGNPFKFIKWKYAFEIAHGFFDTESAVLAAELKALQLQERAALSALHSIRQFLKEAGVQSVDERERRSDTLAMEIEAAQEAVSAEAASYAVATQETSAMARQREELSTRSDEIKQELAPIAAHLRNLGRLRVQYEREYQHLEFAEESGRHLSGLPVSACPACHQTVLAPDPGDTACHVCKQELPLEEEEFPHQQRLDALRARIRDLDDFTSRVQGRQETLRAELRSLRERSVRINSVLTEIERQKLLPYSQRVVEANAMLTELQAQSRELERAADLHEIAGRRESEIGRIRTQIDDVRTRLSEQDDEPVQKDRVISSLLQLYEENLKSVRFPALSGVGVGEDYLPRIRGEHYGELSSKGAISLAQTVWMLTILMYGYQVGSRFPGLVLLDSPLTAVGHDGSRADSDFIDDELVEGLFELLGKINAQASNSVQVLVIDNRPPASAVDLVRVEFTRRANIGRFGLIGDEVGDAMDG